MISISVPSINSSTGIVAANRVSLVRVALPFGFLLSLVQAKKTTPNQKAKRFRFVESALRFRTIGFRLPFSDILLHTSCKP